MNPLVPMIASAATARALREAGVPDHVTVAVSNLVPKLIEWLASGAHDGEELKELLMSAAEEQARLYEAEKFR